MDDQIPIILNHHFINGGKVMIERWMKLQALEREINQELSQALKTIPEAILLNEFYVLYFLNQSEGQSLTVSDLSKKIGLSISATSRMLVKFEENCRVIDRKVGEDKREVQIILTEKGKDLLKPGIDSIEDVLSRYHLDKIEINTEK